MSAAALSGCPVCYEAYDAADPRRRARVLPCGHSACDGCCAALRPAARGGAAVLCPKCRAPAARPPGGFPRNYALEEAGEEAAAALAASAGAPPAPGGAARERRTEQDVRLRVAPRADAGFAAAGGDGAVWARGGDRLRELTPDAGDGWAEVLCPSGQHGWVRSRYLVEDFVLNADRAYEGKDASGRWWPVTVLEAGQDGFYVARVHDGTVGADGTAGKLWDQVHRANLRRAPPPPPAAAAPPELPDAAADALATEVTALRERLAGATAELERAQRWSDGAMELVAAATAAPPRPPAAPEPEPDPTLTFEFPNLFKQLGLPGSLQPGQSSTQATCPLAQAGYVVLTEEIIPGRCFYYPFQKLREAQAEVDARWGIPRLLFRVHGGRIAGAALGKVRGHPFARGTLQRAAQQLMPPELRRALG